MRRKGLLAGCRSSGTISEPLDGLGRGQSVNAQQRVAQLEQHIRSLPQARTDFLPEQAQHLARHETITDGSDSTSEPAVTASIASAG